MPQCERSSLRRNNSLIWGLALLSASMSEDLKSQDAAKPKASFGFAPVGEDAKQGLVNEVFAKVARRYDLMNDLMSGGLHRLWKNDLVSWLAPPKSAAPFAPLHVCGGTARGA